MATLDAFGREFDARDLDPGADPEGYIPELTVRGTTRGFRALAVRHVEASIRAAEAGARPGPDAAPGALLVGVAYGLALSVPVWLALVIAALWLGGLR